MVVMFSFGEDAAMGRGMSIMLSTSHKMTNNSEGMFFIRSRMRIYPMQYRRTWLLPLKTSKPNGSGKVGMNSFMKCCTSFTKNI